MTARSFLRTTVVVCLCAFALLTFLPTVAWQYLPKTQVGLSFTRNTVVAVAPRSAAERAGIRVGDQLDDHTSLEADIPLRLDTLRPSQRVVFALHRAGKTTSYNLAGREVHAPSANWKMFGTIILGVRALLFMVFPILGAILVLRRPGRMTWGFFVFCVGAAFPTQLIVVFWAYVAPLLGLWIGDVAAALADLGPFGLLIFALRFPSDSPTGWRRRLEPIVAVVAVVVAVTDLIAARLGWMGRLDYQIFYLDLIIAAAWLLTVGCLVDTYRKSISSDRQRLKWALWGVAIGFLAILGNYAIADFLPRTPVTLSLARLVGTAAIIMPLTVGYAILKYRVIDVSLVLNRAASYIVATTIVAGGFAAVFWTVSRAMVASNFAVLAQLGMMVLFGIVFLRSYGAVQSHVMAAISKPWRLRIERARLAVSVLPRVPTLEAIEKILIADIGATLDLEAAALLRCSLEMPEVGTSYGWDRSALQSLMSDLTFVAYASSDAEGLPRTERYWTSPMETGSEAPALVVPISVRGTTQGILMYGGHRTGAALDRADVDVLHQAAAAATRAYAAIFDRAETIRHLSVLFDPESRPEQLQNYTAEYILGSLPARTQDALIACCSLPGPSIEEIIVATGNPHCSTDLAQLAMVAPFLRRSPTGVYTVPQSFALTISQRFKLRAREFNIRCAQQCLENRFFERASTFFAAAGDDQAALSTLEMFFEQNLTHGVFRITTRQKELLTSADPTVLHIYPLLWLAQALERYVGTGCARLRNEALNVAGHCQSASSSAKLLLADWMAFLSQASGGSRATHLAFLDMSAENAPHFAVLRALIEARIKLSLGETAAGRSCAEYAIELAHGIGSSLEAIAYAEALFIAWLFGDEKSEQRCRAKLQEISSQYSISNVAILSLENGEDRAEINGDGMPRYLAITSLMRACRMKTLSQARRHANIALNYATTAGDALTEIIVRLALSAHGGADEEAHLQRALERAASEEPCALTESVEAVISGEGESNAFGDLFSRRIPAQLRAAEDATIEVHIAGARVSRGGETVALSGRERAVMVALSRHTRPCGPSELTDLLWPEHEEAPATKALQVCIHRIRTKLGDADAILSTQQGYQLREDIDVDVPRLEAFLRDAKVPLDRYARLRLLRYARELAEAPQVDGALWEWYAPLRERVVALTQTALQLLAKDALHRSEPARALQYAAQMIALDGCDDAANELCILAYMKLGDTAGARRHFRRYRDLLARELHVEPAGHLRDLVRSMPLTSATSE